MTTLHDPARHQPLRAVAWSADRARDAITRIVRDTEDRYSDARFWPLHPRDADGEDPARIVTPLYHGACGVVWALHYLQGVGAANLARRYEGELGRLLDRNRDWLGDAAERERASFLMGETPIRMMRFDASPSDAEARALEDLIAGNVEHPARELMWGSPGTLLAARFLHERTGDARWATLFRRTAATLWQQLERSPRRDCSVWTQHLYGHRAAYLGAVHGFVATALPLLHGRHLLGDDEWAAWERCIVETVRRNAERSGDRVNWPPALDASGVGKWLVQVCHGSPGFVVCLADWPTSALDDLLLAAGESIWHAGPLVKGSNLCHGTGGNGYALLKLHARTGDAKWLERARAFAMHGIMQTDEEAARHGRMRYSLWTGDLGFAIYLWDCIRATPRYPTLDVFYAPRA